MELGYKGVGEKESKNGCETGGGESRPRASRFMAGGWPAGRRLTAFCSLVSQKLAVGKLQERKLPSDSKRRNFEGSGAAWRHDG